MMAVPLHRACVSMEPARLLLVDDEPRILRSLERVFRPHYAVRATSDPQQALQWCAREHFHAVLCDQRMPQLSGVELLRAIRLQAPDTVRLLLTGYADLPALIASINDGEIFRYLTKPWVQSVLLDTVAHAVQLGLQLERLQHGQAPLRRASMAVPVMVYDDDPDSATRLAAALGERYAVTGCSELDPLLQFCAGQPAPILVAETELGGISSVATLRSLRQACPDLIIVALAARTDASTLVQLVNECQVFRFLAKPAGVQRLVEALGAAAVLQQRLASATGPSQAVLAARTAPAARPDRLARRILEYFRTTRRREA